MKRLLVLALLAASLTPLYSQCFSSAGNPVGGTGNLGVLDRRTLSTALIYKHFSSEQYFEGSRPSDINMMKHARFNYVGSFIAYGLTNTLTLESELGYFINKTKTYRIPDGYQLTGSGLTNAVLSAKYQLYYNPEKKFEFSAAAGIKTPFTLESKSVDNVRLPFDLQPSTAAFGAVFQAYLIKQDSYHGMRYFLYHRTEINTTNRSGFHTGPMFIHALMISRHLIRTSSWPVSGTVIVQLRNEIRGRNYIHDEVEPASGSNKLILSPQLNLAFHEKWNVSVMVDIPVYQNYQYIQLADQFGISVVLIKPVEL